MTKSEKILWKYLSNRGMCGYKFRRQFPIGRFILDFYCPEKRLAIEIDGGIHNNLKEYDDIRQQIVEDKGIDFLRFKNEDIIERPNEVLKLIKRKIIPSPQSGEGWPEQSEGRDEAK